MDWRHATKIYDNGKGDDDSDKSNTREKQPRDGKAPLFGVTVSEEQDRGGRQEEACNSQSHGPARCQDECNTRRSYCPETKEWMHAAP
jgi:hypothetical protein